MRKFLLVDDHSIVRSGMKFLLSEVYENVSIDEACNDVEAIEKVVAANYDFILMDIEMPGTNTIKLIEHILSLYQDARILMFSMNAENVYGNRYIKAGAKGYLSKGASVDEIKTAIDTVLKNKHYYSDSMLDGLINEMQNKPKDNPFEKLSEREFSIVHLLLKGMTITEISSKLNIQPSTTGTYKARLFDKLQVKNIMELADLAKAYNLKY
jgi:two-component system invasion response regulator UvrY